MPWNPVHSNSWDVYHLILIDELQLILKAITRIRHYPEIPADSLFISMNPEKQ